MSPYGRPSPTTVGRMGRGKSFSHLLSLPRRRKKEREKNTSSFPFPFILLYTTCCPYFEGEKMVRPFVLNGNNRVGWYFYSSGITRTLASDRYRNSPEDRPIPHYPTNPCFSWLFCRLINNRGSDAAGGNYCPQWGFSGSFFLGGIHDARFGNYFTIRKRKPPTAIPQVP